MPTTRDLMSRAMVDVFSNPDPGNRAAAVREIFTDDAVFYEPDNAYEGIDAIERHAEALLEQKPGWVFTPRAFLEGKNIGLLTWGRGPAGEAFVHTGRDIALLEKGRIRRLYVLIGEPTLEA